MVNPEIEVDRLRQELTDVEAAFWSEYADIAMRWQFVLGPVKIRRRTSAMFVAQAFVLFHIACFAVGAGLIFIAGPTRELGIAIVVGSIFAFGSFVGQFWAIANEREREILRETMGGRETAELKSLAVRREEILAQITQLEAGVGEVDNSHPSDLTARDSAEISDADQTQP
jgi:hypothetical protein